MTRRTIEIVAFLAALLIAALALHAWLASRDEQQRLQSTLTAQKKVLDAADARESARNTNLIDALTQITALKRAAQTPEQIVHNLPKYLPLPQPITLTAPAAGSAAAPSSLGKASEQGTESPPQEGTDARDSQVAAPKVPTLLTLSGAAKNSLPDAPLATQSSCTTIAACSAQIPSADLKPLYDYVQDCRACQAELSVARQNSADDAAKIAALANERDAAIAAAKGGTFWRRLRRNAEWLAVGAALGCAAGYAASR